ncbi:DUF2752 domain-containing protein [Streptomyces aidingensis]|uniref:DUF2752 domain-containing protein n=1 Tax=Streptomyces aidingensis TaxID=910347 RepID=A0A1I1MGC9_9ACTN|nr:DUF2752 domain-containing protein [Streptomyces aidingensis]SFC84196.1 Protein of unknown function [Streptomyces aidingensis]
MAALPPAATALARRTAAPLTVLGAGLAALGLAGAVDPHRPGALPVCPVLSLTGFHCPGCGGLRAAHALAHGDPAAALSANALAVTAGALLAVLLLRTLVSAARDRLPPGRPPLPAPGRAAVLAAVICVTAFTVLRNLPIPAGAVLAP